MAFVSATSNEFDDLPLQRSGIGPKLLDTRIVTIHLDKVHLLYRHPTRRTPSRISPRLQSNETLQAIQRHRYVRTKGSAESILRS